MRPMALRKSDLVAAYRLGYANTSKDYSNTHRERMSLMHAEQMQYYAGWLAKSRGEQREVKYKVATVMNDNHTITDKIEQMERRGWHYERSEDAYTKNDVPDEDGYCSASNMKLFFWKAE